MEVEEENTSNHLQESASTTVANERLMENNTGNDKELQEKEEEEEQPSVIVPKLNDPKPTGDVTALEDVNSNGGVDTEDEGIEIVQEDEGITKGNDEGVVAGVVKDEDVGVAENFEEEVSMADAGTVIGVTEAADEDKVVVAEKDEEKSSMLDEDKVIGVTENEDAEALLAYEDKVTGVTEKKEEEASMADEDKGVGVAEKDEEEVPEENEDVEKVLGVTGVTERDEEEVQVEDEEKVIGVTAKDEEEASMAGEHKVLGVVEKEEEETSTADPDKVLGAAEKDEEEVSMADEDEILGGTKKDEEAADEDEVLGVAEKDEEGSMANEDKVLGVAEKDKEQASTADDEKVLGVTDKDEEEEPFAEKDEETDEEEDMADEEEDMAEEEEVPDADISMEKESRASHTKGRPSKRKRGGKNSKATKNSKTTKNSETTKKSKTTPKSSRKMTEEDVCFICFDGGELVLCDHRNCPKAYHPSCVNREPAFFKTKGRWNCGWHLCSICEKKAEYMCYTCTFSLCKACIKTNDILCVREKEKKGFCETCMKTVMLIEKDSEENQENVDFDDKSSWEYLFKDYWMDLKTKLDLSLDELVEAKNPWRGSELSGKQESPAARSDLKDDGGSGSENPSENPEPRQTRRRLANKRKSAAKDAATVAAAVGSDEAKNIEWATKELLEFVDHMRNGNNSFISQFDVQALLLEYIKTNNLRDSRRKSQIRCDARLERLFGKPRVGHFEMLKLLESHFLIKEDSQIDDIQGSVVDTEVSQIDEEEANETLPKGGKDRKRKTRKKGDREPQSNREDYAAIDIHNISLIYLRRKLVEDLLGDTETFHSKVVGTFVRIRISGANHKQDIYRLVQVTGTTKAAEYTVGKKKTDTMLEILNLDKTESISIDTISNQEFTEDECKRLRQSIKCGFINRLTVGDILDKAMELQAARVNDWLETEVMRLSHLRDRASDLGRKKELRECVEKLQVLKTPEERARRLEEFPLINVDPTMDPNYESEDNTDPDDKKQDEYNNSSGSRFSKRREYPLKDSWSGTGSPRSSGKNYEFTRNLSNKNFSNKAEDPISGRPQSHNENSRDQGRDPIVKPPSILKKPSSAKDDLASRKDALEIAKIATEVNEMEKMWHYKDPSGKIQGPFSMVQLRKWSNNKYFPVDLKIWRKIGNEEDGILLTDALEGRFTRVETANFPSPTPNRSVTGLGQVGPYTGPGSGSYPGGNEGLQSPTPSSLAAPPDSNMPLQMVHPVGGHSLPVGPHGWNSGAPMTPQPSHMSNMAGPGPGPVPGQGQPHIGYNHWVPNVPNMVQNPAGNFLQQPPPPVNLPPPPPPQPNGTWPAGWAGPTPGNHAGPAFNIDPTWVLQAGSVPAPPAQPNQGWAGPLANNPGFVAPAMNHAPGSGLLAGNQGAPPGNSNRGWVSPGARTRPNWDGPGGEHRHNRSGFSGQKRNRESQGSGSGFRGNNRRQWDKPGWSNNRGSRHSPRSSDR